MSRTLEQRNQILSVPFECRAKYEIIFAILFALKMLIGCQLKGVTKIYPVDREKR